MPILRITPDMMAETWLGALACAPGSQTCSGMMPAFKPKPINAQTKIAVAMPGASEPASSASSVQEPLAARNRPKSANRKSAATWVATR